MSNHTPQAASSAEEKQNHAWRKTEEITQIVSKEWIRNIFDLAQALFFMYMRILSFYTHLLYKQRLLSERGEAEQHFALSC